MDEPEVEDESDRSQTVDREAATPSMVEWPADDARRRAVDPVPERLAGRYRVVRTLGQGGMGTVLEAVDEDLDRTVAVKLLLPHVAERHGERLRREAEALAKLSHPNIVQVYDVGDADGRLFVVMELVRGQTLWMWQREPRRSLRERVAVYVQAGRGLAAAHAEGLVHRDFKPGNCMIDESGRVRVLDFGLARDLGVEVPDAPVGAVLGDAGREVADRLTRTGAVLGTVAYMPVEQLMGRPADARSDQFSYCVSLYEALYGARPFEAKTPYEQLEALQAGPPPQPDEGGVSAELWRVLRRGLARDPAGRWPSMEALVDALDVHARPSRRRWWALGGLSLAALGGGLMAVSQALASEPCTGAADRLTEVWNDDTRQSVERALTVSGEGSAAWAEVEPLLDEHAQTWVSAYDDSCADTFIREEQTEAQMDRRVQCLDERLRELRAATEVLSAADQDTASSAMKVVKLTLLDIARCEDLEYLEAQVPMPADPVTAAEVEALDEAMSVVTGELGNGRYLESLPKVERILARLAEVPYGPLQVEARWRKGWILTRLGRHEEALETLKAAFFEAERWQLDHLQGMTNTTIIHVLTALHRPEEALEWGRHAEALLERIDDPSVAKGIYGDIGFAYMKLRRYEEALEYYRRAQELAEAHFGPEHVEVASLYHNVGGILLSSGDLDRSLEYMERALALKERHHGPRHPALLSTLHNIGRVHERRGEYGRARQSFERELSIARESFGPRDANVADVLSALGGLENAQGRYARAGELLEEALSITEETKGSQVYQIAVICLNLGNVDLESDDHESAIRNYARAVSVLEEIQGPDHPNVAIGLMNMGNAFGKGRDYPQAMKYYERALAIQRSASPSNDRAITDVLINIGVALFNQGELSKALERFREALALQPDEAGLDDDAVGNIRRNIGEVLLHMGEPSAAIEPLEHALSIFERRSVALEYRGEVRFLLARARLEAGGDPRVARVLARMARDEYDAAEGDHTEAIGEIDRWLHVGPGATAPRRRPPSPAR